jgi:hypothetical protein
MLRVHNFDPYSHQEPNLYKPVEELIQNRAQPHEEGMKQSKDTRRDYSMNAQHEFNTNSHMHLRKKL